MNTRIRKKKKLLKYSFSKKEIYNAGFTASEYLYALIYEFRHADRYSYPYALTPRKWDEVLDAMLWSLDQVRRDYPDSPDSSDSHDYESKDKFKSDLEEYNAKMDQGLGYFAKYIHDLWD